MTIAAAHPFSNAALGHDPIRVMVVDDSAAVRALLARWIAAEAGPRSSPRYAAAAKPSTGWSVPIPTW